MTTKVQAQPLPVPDVRAATSGRRFIPGTQTIVIGAVVLVIGYLVAAPLLYLLWGTFFDENGFTLDSFSRALGDADAPRMIANSLIYAVGSMVLAVVLGAVQAYIYVRTDAPFRRLLFASSLVPIILPAVLYAPAWVLLGSERIGLFNKMLEPVLGFSPFNIYSMWGMIWVEGLHLAPIVFLLMVASLRSMDPSLEEAARVGGARPLTVIRKITVPLSRPAILSATVLLVVLGLESFEVPAMIGIPGDIYVLTTRIYFLLGEFPSDLGAAGALSISLLLVAVFFVLLGRWGKSGAKGYQTVTGKAFRPRPTELMKARPYVGAALLVYFFIAVAAPVLALLYSSLHATLATPSLDLSEFSLKNYETVANMPKIVDALKNTVLLAGGSATVVMVLAAVAGWFVVRSKARGRSLVDGLAFMPLVIPGLVIGLGVSFVYLRSSVPIYGTIWILLIAYVTRFLPFGMRYAHSAMTQIANELEESAMVSGASWWQTFRRVVLPLAWPGILSGWIFVFMVSFRELGASILLFSDDTYVLSILIFQEFFNGSVAVSAAIGMLLVLLMVLILLAIFKLGSRFGVRIE